MFKISHQTEVARLWRMRFSHALLTGMQNGHHSMKLHRRLDLDLYIPLLDLVQKYILGFLKEIKNIFSVAEFVMAIFWKIPRYPCMEDTWFRSTQWDAVQQWKGIRKIYISTVSSRGVKNSNVQNTIKQLNIWMYLFAFAKKMQET